MLSEKVDLNVEAVQELPSAYCGIINPKKNDYNKVVISRVEEIIKVKGETWKSIEKAIGVEKLWNKVHKNPKKAIMQQMADYLNCNIGYFYGMDIDPFYKGKPIKNKCLLIKTLKDVKDEKITRKEACEILNITNSLLGYLLIEYGYSKDDIYTLLKKDKIDVNEFIKICEDINNNKASINITAKLFKITRRKCRAYYRAYNNLVLNKPCNKPNKEQQVLIKPVKPTSIEYDQSTVDVLRLYNKNIINGATAAKLLDITKNTFSIISIEFGYTDIIRNFKSERKYKSANEFIKSLTMLCNGDIKRKDLLNEYGVSGASLDRYVRAFKNGIFQEYLKTGKICQINPCTKEIDNFTVNDLNYELLKNIEEPTNEIDKALLHTLLKEYYYKEIKISEGANKLKISSQMFSNLIIQYGYVRDITKAIKSLGFEYLDEFIYTFELFHYDVIDLKEAMLRCGCSYRTFVNYLKAYENGVFDGTNRAFFDGCIHQINPETMEIDNYINLEHEDIFGDDKEIEEDNMSSSNNNEDIVTGINDDNTCAKEINITAVEDNIDESNNDFEDPSEIIKCVINTLQKYNSCFNNSIESRINKLEGADRERAAFLIDSVLKSFNV